MATEGLWPHRWSSERLQPLQPATPHPPPDCREAEGGWCRRQPRDQRQLLLRLEQRRPVTQSRRRPLAEDATSCAFV